MSRATCRSLRIVVSLALTAALVLGVPTTAVLAAGGVAGAVGFTGKILDEQGSSISGAKVHAIHLDTKQIFTSAPSSGSGEYALRGLPLGYFDLVVESSAGVFLANRVVNAPAGETVEISLLLGPPRPEDTEWWSADPNRRIAGLDRSPDGVARIVEGKPPKAAAIARGGANPGIAPAATSSGSGFWAANARWLVPTLAVVGAVGLAAVLSDDDDEDVPASPFQ